MKHTTAEYAAAAAIILAGYLFYISYKKLFTTVTAILYWVLLALIIAEFVCHFTDKYCELSISHHLGVDFSSFHWGKGCASKSCAK